MRSEAWKAGAQQGRDHAKDGALLHAIEPPDTFTDAERDDFILGYLVGQRSQWNDDRIRELAAHLGDDH